MRPLSYALPESGAPRPCSSRILIANIVGSLVPGRLTRWNIPAPIALIVLGMAAGW
ncbi:hypothetical protein [Kocuria sp.]|uniref:hypothetical protein n=1 Tax=Kocuria sp. TaxID=1871328 RepID=UPI002897AA64|nr:hypothetical protein [Kocuria sp.]